ncbi:hypothetical protein KAR91_09275 [Candidatus Pacearchaeota archaeon]|nr:hypothetical protein [Candidatus Pacearchaeota archaeon]
MDLLRMDYINSLPQPFLATLLGRDEWQVYDIDVETGLMRIDVVGKLQPIHISDVLFLTDEAGNEHDPDTFYSDYSHPPANPMTDLQPLKGN